MSLFISSVFTYDEDAGNYIQAVETADAQALEPATRKAINNFVIGCKQDGIWTAIKASCILAGARTLAGALTPLVGTAPTPFGFVGLGTDYVRKTGLVGDGSTKYLNSNRNNNADPQNSKHLAVWRSTAASVNGGLLGSGNSTGDSGLYTGFASFITTNNSSNGPSHALTLSPASTFYGTTRSDSANFAVRHGGVNYSASVASQTPADRNISVFQVNIGGSSYTDARLAFHSIGESLDLALLDARVTDLINAFAVTIP